MFRPLLFSITRIPSQKPIKTHSSEGDFSISTFSTHYLRRLLRQLLRKSLRVVVLLVPNTLDARHAPDLAGLSPRLTHDANLRRGSPLTRDLPPSSPIQQVPTSLSMFDVVAFQFGRPRCLVRPKPEGSHLAQRSLVPCQPVRVGKLAAALRPARLHHQEAICAQRGDEPVYGLLVAAKLRGDLRL